MKVTQEKLPASQIGLTVEIEPDVSQKAYEKTLRDYTRQANIPGFRRGKVPRKVLIQRFGAMRIKATVLEQLIQDSLEAAIRQEKIEALGNLELRSSFEELVKQFNPGEVITISAAVDVPPEASLEEYTGWEVQAEEIKYDDAQVDAILEDYQNRTATLVPVEDRACQMGDAVVVDFTGVLAETDDDGEPIPVPGGSAEDFQLDLEEGKFIPGFIDGIVGMEAGSTKDVTATFPESYPEESVAGKEAIFTVELKEIKEKELPDLDDDFAQEVSEYETLAELRQSLEDQHKEKAEQQTDSNIAGVLLAKLADAVEAELPESMIQKETELIVNQTVMQLQQQGIDVRKVMGEAMLNSMKDGARPDATRQIKQRLAIAEIAKKEDIKVDDEKLEAKVSEFAEQFSDRDIDMGRLRSFLEEDVLQEQVLSWLKENNTIDLVPEGSLSKDEAVEGEAETEALSEPEPEATEVTVEVEAEDATADDATEK